MKQKTANEAEAPRKEYVPLWKQYRDSPEFEDYKMNELPSVEKVMREFDGQFKMQKERNELMATEFNVRWVDANSGRVQETSHKSEKAAKDKARELSFQSPRPVQVGEVDDKDGSMKAHWSYSKGKQETMDAKKQVSVAPITKVDALKLKTNMDLKGNKVMATKNKTTKAAKANGKAPAKAVAKAPSGKGTVRDSFMLREGSNKAKLVDALLDAKGKAVALGALMKATYGNAKDENVGAIGMVIKGVQATIEKNKIKFNLIRTKDEKGVSFALKAK